MNRSPVNVAVLLLCAFEIATGRLTWTRLDPVGGRPAARRDAGIAYDPTNNRLFLFGGTGAGILHNDLWMYSFASNTWTEIHGNVPDSSTTFPNQRFSVVTGFYPEGNLFLVSTGEGNNKEFFNDVWAFNTTVNTARTNWRQLPARGPLPEERYGATGGLHPNGTGLYVTHGFSSRRFSNTFRYDLRTLQWSEAFGGTHEYSATQPHPRCLLAGTVVSPEEPVMFGGCLSGGFSGGPCPSVDSWAFRSGEWKRLDDCASARQFPAMAAWPANDSTAVLFSGDDTDRALIMNKRAGEDEVEFVNTATGNWRRLRVTGVNPGRRQGHSMAALREGVVMFGGNDFSADTNDLWMLTGNPDLAPSAGSCGPRWFLFQHLHGFFMIISWGILLISGVFIARYFRHRAPTWFKLHQGIQIAGACLSLLGIILVFPGTRAVPNFAHGVIGVLILIFSIQQIINGLLRPHKEKDQEPPKKRVYWEYWHMWGGRLFLILGVINISLGVYLVIAPTGVIVVWFLIFAAWVIAFIVMEIRLQLKAKDD